MFYIFSKRELLLNFLKEFIPPSSLSHSLFFSVSLSHTQTQAYQTSFIFDSGIKFALVLALGYKFILFSNLLCAMRK